MPLLLGYGISMLKAKLSENFYDILGTLEISSDFFYCRRHNPAWIDVLWATLLRNLLVGVYL